MINQTSGNCVVCQNFVQINEGFHKNLNSPVFCKNCINDKILTIDGKIYTPYNPNYVNLIKSLNGSKWNGYYWQISLKEADRPRLLEIAQQINLKVPNELKAPLKSPKIAFKAGLIKFQEEGANWLSMQSKAILGDDMGLGKAQPLTSNILTPTGWVKMKDVKLGQKIIGKNGKTFEITGIFPQGIKKIYKVTFSDNSHVECCADHLWAVNTANRNFRGNPYKTLPLSSIIKLPIKNKYGNSNHFIPIVHPIEMEVQNVPLDPYFLGYLIANGCLTQNTPSITIPDLETLYRIEKLIPFGTKIVRTTNDKDCIYFNIPGINKKFEVNPLTKILRELNLMGKYFNEKSIPINYLFNSLEIRIKLLQGLMDGDGSVSDNHLEYSTGSKELANQFLFLVQSLGGIAKINLKEKPKYFYKGKIKIGEISYKVSICLPNEILPFILSRKANSYKGRIKYLPLRAIKFIEELPKEVECQCIATSALDGLYITDNCVVTHNTVQSLAALSEDGYGLVVAPAGLKYNWKEECLKWRKDLIPTILTGKDSFRWPHKQELIITNYEILPDWLKPPTKCKNYREIIQKWEKQLKLNHPEGQNITLIVDEAHSCKNYKTQRSQKMKTLAGLVKNVWGLTGTPLMNRPIDLYGVLDSLKMSYLVFNGLDHFRQLFGAFQNNFNGWEYGNPSPLVPELLRRVMLRRKREEVLPDLPDKTYTVLQIDLDKKLNKEMDILWEEYEKTLIAKKLPPFEKFSEIRERIAFQRIDSMLEFVENAEEEEVPLVVFSCHLAPLDRLLLREGWTTITGDTKPERRQEIVNDFQNGKLKGVGVSIRAGGVGINLSHAWKALFVDLDWNPSINEQAESRLLRIGQKSNKVNIVRMVSNHPLDIHISKLLTQKIEMIEKTIC